MKRRRGCNLADVNNSQTGPLSIFSILAHLKSEI
jgi:hypothetical protein